jgi:hypothetical protein
MISLKVLSTAAVMALVLPMVTPTASFAQQQPSAHRGPVAVALLVVAAVCVPVAAVVTSVPAAAAAVRTLAVAAAVIVVVAATAAVAAALWLVARLPVR